jgi:hypothetical protein
VNTSRRLLIAAQLLLAVAYTLPVFSSHLITDSDFLSFYTGWAIVRNGEGNRLYDLDVQVAYQAEVLGPAGAPFRFRLLPFINPPHAALILMPFGCLSPKSAAFAFLVFNCLVTAWILRRLWQLAAGWTPASRILLLTTFLGTEVLWYGLATRTMTLMVFACLIEYYRALKDGEDTRAAIWLVAATLKPQLILLPALIPLALRRWRLVVIAASLGLIVALSASLILGFHIWVDYVRLLGEVSVHGEKYGASPVSMSNLRMILFRTLPSSVVLPLVYLGLLGGVAGACLLWHTARQFEMKFALTLLLGLFLAPHSNYQDTLVAFLPASIGYDWVRLRRRNLLKLFPLSMLVATFVPAALIFSGYSRTWRWIWPLPIIIVLIGVCARALQRDRD